MHFITEGGDEEIRRRVNIKIDDRLSMQKYLIVKTREGEEARSRGEGSKLLSRWILEFEVNFEKINLKNTWMSIKSETKNPTKQTQNKQ